MGKFTTYILIMSGLVLLFYFTGIVTDTTNATFLNLLLSPESFKDSDLNLKVILALEGIVATGILAAGLITRQLELAVKGVIVIYLFNLLWDFIKVFNAIKETNVVFAVLIFAPLLLLYYVTAVEWWGKHDA